MSYEKLFNAVPTLWLALAAAEDLTGEPVERTEVPLAQRVRRASGSLRDLPEGQALPIMKVEHVTVFFAEVVDRALEPWEEVLTPPPGSLDVVAARALRRCDVATWPKRGND